MQAIRSPTTEDRYAWDPPHQGYTAVYLVVQTAGMGKRVCGWLLGLAHECQCLMIYDARRSQADTQLIAAVKAHAEQAIWSLVLCITADNIYRARNAWITYNTKR